ncbi:MAG: amino acid transporter [Haloquadratum walsbyi J07HQW1]|uniref:Amino acid transporter n=1 Tax=Haloquadratum walsbyi J07HQW1 TaxID=1238424 RepID=U1PK62_9EURY|nr:MAG: amino acid transporter [Haloquadratum walsbyi J07HQW1]
MGDSESSNGDDGEIQRTIGLLGATTIGTGIMIGAGIFVFPGLAVGRVGPAASISFAIGAVISLLVALPASELATAMPKSGGGYYFISRGLGSLPGALVGIGLVFGLVFASAFYLVGLGEYVAEILVQAGLVSSTAISIGPANLVLGIGIIVGILLTILSTLGTENTESIQNVVVALLISILIVFLSIGGLDILGVSGDARLGGDFAPAGYAPILSTAALVFTSYLGFVQVATVAEDITNPDRNLPLAMIGSVMLVGVLYVFTMLVAGYTFPAEEIRGMGETAIVEVAGVYLGFGGVIAILLGGLLATISSANASILSASRALYGLSSDDLVPEAAAEVNEEYGTPHFALAFVGGTTVVLVAFGRTEVLAEVASFLHLILYGLICVALIVIRRRDPLWYEPSFTCPGYPLVPIIGGVGSFALIGFMELLSQVLGVIVSLVAVGWYLVYARDVGLKNEL